MRIAIVGSGIAGMVSAWLLAREHEVVLFEANDYLGGHTHTHDIELGEQRFAVDSGFIVFNPGNYPLLTQLFDELGVATQPTTMSFAVRNDRNGLEYNAHTLATLFCQRRNLLSPRFLGMLYDIVRFYREAPALLQGDLAGPVLGDYLRDRNYGAAFRDDHLIPMASALWSAPAAQILQFPARYLVQFMANHHMLQLRDRPQWRVVSGGSTSYVRALRARWKVEERIGCPVHQVRRTHDAVSISSSAGVERFDHVVLAAHSDQSLNLLVDASAAERDILGAITYQPNDTVLHTDASLMPRRRKAWAAWNALVPRTPGESCRVSYCMNLLQSLTTEQPLLVTLNATADIDPARILRRLRYAHPVYTHAAVAAQKRKAEIQGQQRTWFAGAYWGWGFHEDGIASAVQVARALGIHWT